MRRAAPTSATAGTSCSYQTARTRCGGIKAIRPYRTGLFPALPTAACSSIGSSSSIVSA